MTFKNQKEYEKEKDKWKSSIMRDRSPAGYDAFLRNESAYLSAQEAAKNNPSSGSQGSGARGSNGLQIRGNAGSGYSGNTMSIKASDSQILDFGTVFSDKDLTDPGTKFAKKGKFKDYLSKIQGKHFDKDGNLVVPEFDMPDRVKLSKEQKAANDAIDSQFDDNGFYNVKDAKMPKINQYKTKKSYRKGGKKLARRLGINPSNIERRNNGKKILRKQANKYRPNSKTLKIPDFSLGGMGQDLMKIGTQYTDLSGVRS